MQFTTLALSAAVASVALAQNTNVHVVTVGSKSGGLSFTPNNLKAAVGDMVQFQFAAGNHTVTQSTFDQPCEPIGMNSNITGFYSGFVPVAADAADTAAYTVPIKNLTPIWVYCSQGPHCQKGMTMVINENPAKNASRTLKEYQALAAKATVNLPGDVVTGGTPGNAGDVPAATSPDSTDSGSAGASGTTPNTPTDTSDTSPASTTGGAMALSPSVTVAGMLALFMGLMM